MAARRGRVLRAHIDSPTYAATYVDPRGDRDLNFPLDCVPYLKLAAVADDTGGVTLFALNRHLSEEMPLRVSVRDMRGGAVEEAVTLYDTHLNAANTRQNPDRIKPVPLAGQRIDGNELRAKLPPTSWAVIRVTGSQ
jgi:alpha-N-arabinofuranosidase